MKEILKNALNNSYSYQDYRKTVTDLLQEGNSSGAIQSEALVNYSRLNETRMHRLDKTIVIDQTIVSKFKAIQSKYIWLVIAEGWCGDAAQILPIFNKMSEVSDHIDFKIVFQINSKLNLNPSISSPYTHKLSLSLCHYHSPVGRGCSRPCCAEDAFPEEDPEEEDAEPCPVHSSNAAKPSNTLMIL